MNDAKASTDGTRYVVVRVQVRGPAWVLGLDGDAGFGDSEWAADWLDGTNGEHAYPGEYAFGAIEEESS